MSPGKNEMIAAVFDASGMTAEQYEQIITGLEAAGQGAPPGRLYHVACAKPGGWFVVDIWESAEALDRFAQTLMPLIQESGATPPQPQIFPVHNIVKG